MNCAASVEASIDAIPCVTSVDAVPKTESPNTGATVEYYQGYVTLADFEAALDWTDQYVVTCMQEEAK
jgi:copper chaperone CopZ